MNGQNRNISFTKVLGLMMVIILTSFMLSGCASTEKQLEKAAGYVSDKEYEKAVTIYNKLIKKSETNYDAWIGLAKAYIKSDDLKEADKTLSDLFDIVKDNYDPEDEKVDYESVLKNMKKLGATLLKEEEVGEWYAELNPAAQDVSTLLSTYDLGAKITFEVPEGLELYYTIDGKDPSKKGIQYKDGIELTSEGAIELRIVLMNSFNLTGDESTASFSVYDAPPAPVPDQLAGDYEGPLTILFKDFDSENFDIYYTTDETDPGTAGFTYDPEVGVVLESGSITLRAVMYSYEQDKYSDLFEGIYNVKNPYSEINTSLTLAVAGVSQAVYDEISTIIGTLSSTYPNIEIDLSYYEYTEDIDIAADLIYTGATYAEDFAQDQSVLEVNEVMDLSDIRFLKDALEGGNYMGKYYCLPVTIEPEMMLYANKNTDQPFDTFEAFTQGVSVGDGQYGFLYPTDYGDFLMGIYYGLGGAVLDTANEKIAIDATALTNAIQFVKDLTATYGLGVEGMDTKFVDDALYAYSVNYAIAGDWVYNDYYYYPNGKMPLPGGKFAQYYNTVNGLFLSSTMAQEDQKKMAAILIYNTLANTGENVYWIAAAEHALPANADFIDSTYLYENMTSSQLEEVINNNITAIQTYSLYALYDIISTEMTSMLTTNDTAANVANKIIAAWNAEVTQ